MANTKHNKLFDTVNEIFTDAKNKGVMHLSIDSEGFDGRSIQIDGKKLLHFGTTSYMGLDLDMRLKEASIQAILKYGTQFPLSRAYLSHSIYTDLEDTLEQLFGCPAIVTKNSTMAHLGVIPSIVRDEDAVILDHQVHHSVQNACSLVKVRGVRVEIIRHNNLDMLEDMIKELRDTHRKIWFMLDGVYSMFGDFAPLKELVQLMDKYPQLHLYIDDVHGMSWAGKNGAGFVHSVIGELTERMVMVTTLSKSFGASGAVMVTPDRALSTYVKTFGGAISFSAQMDPSSLAASLASAQIHLTPEIYQLQKELSDRVAYCNELMSKTDLPLYVYNQAPLFYLGTGLPSSGFNLTSRLKEDGFYVNMGIFPAVSAKNTGIRFTISRHNTFDDIANLVKAFQYHYPLMMEEEGQTNNQVRKAFNLALLDEEVEVSTEDPSKELTVELYDTIHNVDQSLWDKYLGSLGAYDSNIMKILESVFQNNDKPEDNWKFNYLIIKDKKGDIVLVTLITSSLWKDDMLAMPEVSMRIEKEREQKPYYLTSYIVQVGSLITEGEHIYVNKESPQWKNAMLTLFNTLEKIQEQRNASMVILRDFPEEDNEIRSFITEKGFVKIDMPNTCIIENLPFKDEEEFLSRLSYKSRRHFRTDIDRYKDVYDIEIKTTLTEKEKEEVYSLYMNVKEKNYDINNFQYPFKLVSMLSGYPNFDILLIRIKPEYRIEPEDDMVGFAITYRNSGNNINGKLIGLDYRYQQEYKVYKHLLYNTIQIGNSYHCNKFYMGFTAEMEKKKLGATVVPRVAYIQAKDNYVIELIESIAINHKGK